MRWRSMLAATLSTTLLGALPVVFAPATSAQTAQKPVEPAKRGPAATEADAVQRAAQTGEPVEILEKNTETSQILANPNGSFTLRSNARPVRVKKDNAWRGIDTTLKVNSDGTVTPVAAAADMAFSGGGDKPIVRVADSGAAVSVRWPGPLPKPVLNGNTATYADVLPGVDLKLVADSDTYTQTLVVRNAAAAKNPALASIKMDVDATNLDLRADDKGVLTAVDPTGKVVFAQSTPLMWDSSHDPNAGPAPSAVFSGGGKVSELKSVVTPKAAARGARTAVEMALVPDPAALTGPGVTYPLYIDPVFSRNRSNWAEVTTIGWNSFNATTPARAGRCYNRNGQCNGTWSARSFFSFDVSALLPRNGHKPKLFDGGFYIGQLHAAHACTAEPTTLHAADGFGPGVAWGGPLRHALDTQSSNAGDQCGGGRAVRFYAGAWAQAAVDNSWSALNFGVAAPDEGNDFQWKVFDNNPLLEIPFSYPPNPATGLRVSNEVRCDGKPITSDARPVLFANGSDNNSPPLNLQLNYVLVGPGAFIRTKDTTIASGSTGRWDTSEPLKDGGWQFSVQARTQPGTGQEMTAPISPAYQFTVRAIPPAAAPVIDPSVDYPAGYWGAPNGAPGAISVNANGAANIVGYTYTFTGSGTQTVPKTTDCMYNKAFGTNGGWIPHTGQATNWIPIPAGLSPGYHTLHVRSFDDAHNLSPESQPYTFYVAPNTGSSAQRLEAEKLPLSQPAGQSCTPYVQSRGDIGLSGGSQVFHPCNAVGQSFTMSFDTAVESDYDIGIGLTKANDFGKAVFELDGVRIGQQFDSTDPERPIDTYSPRLQTNHQPLGVRHLAKGTHALTVKGISTNPQSIGLKYGTAVDYISLSQTRRYEAEDRQQVTASQPTGQNVPVVVTQRGTGGPAWSQGAALGFQANAVNQSLDLTFQVPLEADYAMGIGLTKRPDHGQLRIAVDGIPLQHTDSTPWDGYGTGDGASVYQPLGGAHLTAGSHRLTITAVGKNTAASGFQATVDYLTAVAVNNVSAASFNAAMNNDGIGADGSPANLDLGDASLSAQTMAAAGYGPGATATINGARFTMPAPTSAGDNVIAIGQTIPIDQVKATAVGLLVAATCGSSPVATATIRYTDGTTQDSRLPGVDDWAVGRTNDTAFVLPYRNRLVGKDTTVLPRIHAVFLPTDPTKTLQAVTLPNYGTNMLPGSCSSALHVFSMAPRNVATGWIGSWSAPADMARPAPGGARLADQTLRSVIKPSTTGANVRVKLNNTNGNTPVTIDAATIAAQSGTAGATLAAPVKLTFGGNAAVTLPAGGEVLSDPVSYPAVSGGSGNLVVSVHLPSAVSAAPVHTSPTEPTLLANGNATADSTGTPFTTTLDGSRYVSALDVSTTDNQHGTVVVLGDQVSNGGTTWVDSLPGKLAAGGVPVPGGLVNASRSGISPSGQWNLNGNGRDSAGTAHTTATGGVTWSTDRGGVAALDGTGTLATAGPVLATDASYTVSAWVKVNDKTAQTVVSQQGQNTTAFALRTDGTKWAFTLPVSDTAGAATVSAVSSSDIQTGTWTHLVGIHDSSSRNVTLYVNGMYQQTSPAVTSFGSSGTLTIGRALKGSVSEVRAYQGIATYVDAGTLRHGDSAYRPSSGLGASSVTLADSTLNRTVLNQPNLRTAIVALGANDILTGSDKTTITQQLTELMHTTGPTGIRNTRRADGNLVRVVLTTIPALGLSDLDPREQRRRELNADLLANYLRYGANDIIDIAGAVADPQHPNQLKAAYLTNGELNSAYQDAVASAVSTAVTKFPPDAQL
nr:LamG-like jellyroll fold domain-containing protein [Kibdelosporangium sp. MJ126-NF4]CEL14900.1 putative secreted protein [Kibdelosporangium sp. MJ126-NF4]CTQ96470.1 putative secreted protein [Kibdelosporangium sp. MJ126-NF4]